MKTWDERPLEVAHLFNPAFCAAVLGYAARGFTAELATGLPWLLTFVILPIILHKPTRGVSPKTKSTKFHTWIENNPAIRIGFAERASNMVPHVREAIIFGISVRMLVCDVNGTLFPGPAIPPGSAIPKGVVGDSEEVLECLRRARVLGGVLARAGADHTVWAMLGVQA